MVSVDSRINTARQEVDESLSKGDFLHNIVVTDNAERGQYDFYCLSKDRRWASFGIGYEVLVGDFGDFAATISQAITLVHAQFPPIVDPDVTAAAIDTAVQTTPSAPVPQEAPTGPDGAALFLPRAGAGAADPFFASETPGVAAASSVPFPTVQAATPAPRPAPSQPSSDQTSVLPKRSLLDRALGTAGPSRGGVDE